MNADERGLQLLEAPPYLLFHRRDGLGMALRLGLHPPPVGPPGLARDLTSTCPQPSSRTA